MHTHDYEEILTDHFKAITASKVTIRAHDSRFGNPWSNDGYDGWFSHQMSIDGNMGWSIDFKRLTDARGTDLEGYLLRYHFALAQATADSKRMMVLLLPRISDALAHRISLFVEKILPHTPFALLSELGGSISNITSSLNGHSDETVYLPDSSNSVREKKDTVIKFTETEQLLLKTLLYTSEATRNDKSNKSLRISTVKDWATRAGVGYGTTHRLAEKLKAQRFLTTDTYNDFTIRYASKLFDAWFRAEKNKKKEVTYLAPLFNSESTAFDKMLKGLLSKLQNDLDRGGKEGSFEYLYNGWTAVELLDLNHVLRQEGPTEITVNWPITKMLSRSNVFIETERDKALLKVTYYKNNKHIFMLAGKNKIVDRIQVALDVANDEVRGRDQAEHILHGSLGIYFNE